MLKKKKPLIVISTCYFAFLTIMISVMTKQGWINRFDQTIYGWLQPLHPAANTFFVTFTRIGNPLTMTIMTAVLLVIMILIKHWQLGIFVVLNNALGSLLNYLVKHLVLRPRPSLTHLVVENGYSFPSGHATAAVMFFGSLMVISYCLVKYRNLRYIFNFILITLILLLGISRLYVQVHFPSDVVAGYLFASANLLLHWQIAQRTYLKSTLNSTILSMAMPRPKI